eukprot:2192510-Alexandrium_andersonii.AAC.1
MSAGAVCAGGPVAELGQGNGVECWHVAPAALRGGCRGERPWLSTERVAMVASSRAERRRVAASRLCCTQLPNG